jgi:acyl carrier protein
MSATLTHDEIVNALIELFSEQSGEPATLQSDIIEDLGFDSLDFVHTAVEIESEFGIGPIPDSDLFRLRTVEQVVLYVESWLNKQAAVKAEVTAEA